MEYYRKLLLYTKDNYSRQINYIIISNLLDISKLNVRTAFLLKNYMDGKFQRAMENMLDYLDERCVDEYVRNDMKYANAIQYKDWLDISPAHLLPMVGNKFITEKRKEYRRKYKSEMEQFRERYNLQKIINSI